MDTKVNSSVVRSAKGQVPPLTAPLARLVTVFNTDVFVSFLGASHNNLACLSKLLYVSLVFLNQIALTTYCLPTALLLSPFLSSLFFPFSSLLTSYLFL